MWLYNRRSSISPRSTRLSYLTFAETGPPSNCSNYRIISQISYPSKIYPLDLVRIIKWRLKIFVSRQIPHEQAGFVKGKGTRQQILNLKQLIEKSREFNISMIVFFELSKSFWLRQLEDIMESTSWDEDTYASDCTHKKSMKITRQKWK